jgi:hypothetical protein
LQTGLNEIGNLRPEEFVIFTDKDRMFDGRMLSKVMMSRCPACFKKKIPSRNVLFWVSDAENYIAETLDDLKFIVEYAEEVGEGADFVKLIRRFCKEYCVTEAALIDTSEKLKTYAQQLFDDLINLLDVNNATTVFAEKLEEHIGKDRAAGIIKKAVETIRRGNLYYDELMNPRLIRNTNNPAEIAKQYENNKFVKGVGAAVEKLESMLKKVESDKGEYPFIRNEVELLPDGLKVAVLYNIWKYCRLKKGYSQPLREFMELYNKGVI